MLKGSEPRNIDHRGSSIVAPRQGGTIISCNSHTPGSISSAHGEMSRFASLLRIASTVAFEKARLITNDAQISSAELVRYGSGQQPTWYSTPPKLGPKMTAVLRSADLGFL